MLNFARKKSLGIVRRQAALSSVSSYLGAGIGFITVGILFPKFLTTDENGLFKILMSVATLMAQVSHVGLTKVTVKLFPYFRTEDKKHHGFLFLKFSTCLLAFSLLSILFFLNRASIIERNIEDSALLVDYLHYILPLAFFTLIFNIFDSYSRALYRSSVGLLFKDLVQRLLILLCVGLYALDLINLHQMVNIYTLAVGLPPLGMLIILWHSGEINLQPDFRFLNKPLLKEIGGLASLGILTGFTNTLVNNVDVIMINEFLDLGNTGIYGITFYFGTLIIIPSRALNRIASTFVAEAWKENNLKGIKEIYFKTSINSFIVGSLLFIGIWANIENVFEILPDEYLAGKYVIFFIGLGNLIDMSFGVNFNILATSKHYQWDGIFMGVLVVFLVSSNLIFIPILGITGAALASALSLLLFNFMRFWFLYRKFGLQPFNFQHLKVAALVLLVYLIQWPLPALQPFYFDIALRSSGMALIFLFFVYRFRLSEDIAGFMDEIFLKIRKR